MTSCLEEAFLTARATQDPGADHLVRLCSLKSTLIEAWLLICVILLIKSLNRIIQIIILLLARRMISIQNCLLMGLLPLNLLTRISSTLHIWSQILLVKIAL